MFSRHCYSLTVLKTKLGLYMNVLILIVMVVLNCFMATLGHAKTFEVNVTAVDGIDTLPGDGICTVGFGDFCTLRAAVMEANAFPGHDTIRITSDDAIVLLDIQGLGNSASTGDLDIKESVTISGDFQGDDYQVPTIQAYDLDNRIFDVRSTTETFILRRVSIRGGQNENGAGIYVRDGVSDVIVDKVLFTDNVAEGLGGALYNLNANVEINDSYFIGNRAENGGLGLVSDCGHLSLSNSTLYYNQNSNFNYQSLILFTKIQSDLNHCYLDISNTTLASNGGPAIDIDDASESALMTLEMYNNTLKYNLIALSVKLSNSYLALSNNVFAESLNPDNCLLLDDPVVDGNNSGNLDVGDSCLDVLGLGAYLNTAPGLPEFPVQENSWHVVFPPEPDAFIIDRATVFCTSHDQIGKLRPKDGNDDGQAVCDLGAIEYVHPNPSFLFGDSFDGDL